MAIFHLSIKTISRSAGRSATAAIAYRAGERVLDERTGLIHDYERRKGVEHTEIFLPENSPTWASNRAQLWNAAEQAETRKNSTVAREFEVALPAELNKAQRLALVREFASELVQRHGVAVDVAIHEPGNEGDHRNHHAHILVTTRRLTADGFSEKTRELDNQRSGEVEHWRARWAQLSNRHLEISGSQGRIDHRSLAAQREGALARGDYDQAANLDRMPTTHLGPNVVQMEKRGIRTERGAINRDAHSHNAQVTQLAEVRQQIEKEKTRLSILERPDHLLGLLDAKLAVFREVDISRELAQYFSAEEAALVRVEVFRSADLVNLTPERADGAVFATREMIAAEKALAETAERMTSSSRHAVPASKVFAVLDSEPFGVLSEEQRGAVLHITTQADISAITGSAGSGKSTALAAAREVWESQGYRVRGAALAGKAADGLQEGAGIESRTLHALEFALKSGADQLTRRDVLVIDEAGMVGSRQLGRVIELARLAGAKVVLVGDAEQLQPIEAGAAFRVVCERVGVADIATIRRQREDWAKEASQAFARGDTSAGLAAYQERGAVRLEDDRAGARAGLVADWLADKTEGNRIILAHTNADVQAINGAIRQARHEAGDLSRDASFQSARGLREFAAGDRMVFLKNDRALGVKNGMLGTVEQADSGRLSVILDNGERRTVNQGGYDAVDHGYAVTVHKAQGVTVDRAFVLATGGMDRHLAYVAMTRHRDSVVMYAGKAEFGGYEGLSSKLSRARPKESVLDFIERRDIATPRSWIEDGRAVLTSLSDRFSAVVDRLRERFEPETLKGNEHERPNGDRQPTQVDGRATARADAKRSRPGAGKPDLGRIGEVPPPFARGRLRSLSELGVVRFAERGEVLLPHDVPHNVEHQGAERNNALRRDGDGLNEKPASVRETIQGEVNAAQLRELVKQREGERFPSVAANDTRPEKIKADWQAEKSRQFSLVVDKARRVQARAAGQMERQEGKLSRLDQARPQEPTGLLASFKKAAHDQALTGWRTVRAGLEKRFNQVRGRLNSINDYTRKAGPYELPTKGERLAESLAKKARPELAGNFQRVAEKEKAAAIELQRAKIMNRNQEKQERRTMKQESIEELKQRTDKNRVAAEKAERTELDKAGHLARLQGESSEQQSSSAGKDLSAGAEKAGEGTDARKREILERFKEKAAKDRSNEKGRGGR